jgi:hypothetical protein
VAAGALLDLPVQLGQQPLGNGPRPGLPQIVEQVPGLAGQPPVLTGSAVSQRDDGHLPAVTPGQVGRQLVESRPADVLVPVAEHLADQVTSAEPYAFVACHDLTASSGA